MSLFREMISRFGGQTRVVLEQKHSAPPVDEDDYLKIHRGPHYDEFIVAGTIVGAFEIQRKFAKTLFPRMKKQINKYGCTTGVVFEEGWEYWHCNQILIRAIKEELGIHRETKDAILKIVLAANLAFQEFNKAIRFDQVNDGQAGRVRHQRADAVIVALKALQIINTTKFVHSPVNLPDYVTGDQAEYVGRGPRSQFNR